MIKTVKRETRTAIDLVRNFEELVPFSLRDRKTGKTVAGKFIPGWQARAIETGQDIKARYEKPQSALSAKKRLLAELAKFDKSWLLDPATVHSVKTSINHFREALNLVFAVDQKNVNEEYQGIKELRSADGNRIECDLTPYLQKAHKILSKCAEGADKTELKWQDVSCAVALVTGRRMSEIHQSGVFSASGDYELNFSGQLKGKNRQVDGEMLIDAVFVIPTLVRAELVLAGLDWLENEGRRLDRIEGTPEQVNKLLGGRLSKCCRSEWQIISDKQWQAIDPRDRWTYHKFRGLYFVACVHNLGEITTFSTIKRLAPDILGDSNIIAVEPYERCDIAPGSITRI